MATFVYISILHETPVGAREGSYNTTFISWAIVRRSNELLQKNNEKSDDLYSSSNTMRMIKINDFELHSACGTSNTLFSNYCKQIVKSLDYWNS